MKNFKKGFTLVEMLIVVVIIGILAAAILPRLQGAQASARDVAKKTALNQVAQGLEAYNVDKGNYPSTVTDRPIGAATLVPALVPTYLKSIPTNPQSEEVAVKVGNDSNASFTIPAKDFWVAKLADNSLVLFVKVEKPETANYSTKWLIDTRKMKSDLKLCGTVTLASSSNAASSTAPAEENAACNIAATDLLYVLRN